VRHRTALAALAFGIVLLAAVWPCLAVVTVQAAADEQPPDRSALLDGYGWGLPKDGLQLGLFHASDQRTFSYGDTLHLVLRARNTGDEPLELCYAPGDYSIVSAMPQNRLQLDMTPGREPQVLRLEPGEEKAVPGLELRARLDPPGDRDRDVAASTPGDSVGLLPGEYTVEFPYPIWLVDPTDHSGHTAHRARPGIARFTLLDDPTNPWVVERIVYDASGSPSLQREMPADPGAVVTQVAPPPESPPGAGRNQRPVAWGECVNGLQAGLRQEEWEGPVAGPERPGRLTFGFYVLNCTNRQVRVALPDLGGTTWDYSDWSPSIEDSEGNRVDVIYPVLLGGLRALVDYTLASGQCVRTGQLLLELNNKDTAAETGDSYLPKAIVEPGRYTVSCTETASWAAGGRLCIALPTGRVALDIGAADLGREP